MTRSFRILIIACILVLGLLALPVQALVSPAASYCEHLGYNYSITNTPAGQEGFCRMPDNSWVDAWEFLRGRAGQKFNYCALHGYPSKTSSDPKACMAVSDATCSVCVLPGGGETEVTTLMGLSFAETRCGDGRCAIAENFRNCPADCPASGEDGYCVKSLDLKCDPDCVQTGGDPDCMVPGGPIVAGILVLVVVVAIVAVAWHLKKKK